MKAIDAGEAAKLEAQIDEGLEESFPASDPLAVHPKTQREAAVISGLHHVTAMTGDAQDNLDFYAGALGMRLVKRSVNQDDPNTYHLFYADGVGAPGSDLTFFPWGKNAIPGRNGAGLSIEVSLAIPVNSLEYWSNRLERYGIQTTFETRFGEQTLTFSDPDRLQVALVETTRAGTVWESSSVTAKHQVLGLHSARMLQHRLEPTANFLMQTMGFRWIGEEHGWHRYALGQGHSGQLLEIRADSSEHNGRLGKGVIHHLAWRVADDAAELAVRARLALAQRRPTPVIDRFWFKSVYFREPGGAVFEIATDGPGFAVDEPNETLGERLVLPPWLEIRRSEIESVLPKLKMPTVKPFE